MRIANGGLKGNQWLQAKPRESPLPALTGWGGELSNPSIALVLETHTEMPSLGPQRHPEKQLWNVTCLAWDKLTQENKINALQPGEAP